MRHTYCTYICVWACVHMPICTGHGMTTGRSERSVSGVKATPHWKIHTHVHTHTQQWQGSPTHGPLIRGWGFLQHGTMGSSPDCYSQPLSISQPLFWQGMCWPFFCPYHRQTSSPCPGHATTHLHKETTFQRTVTCLPSTGWPHHGCFYTFSGELCSGLTNIKYISMIASFFFDVLLWVYITYLVWFSSTTWLLCASNAHAGKNIYHNHPLSRVKGDCQSRCCCASRYCRSLWPKTYQLQSQIKFSNDRHPPPASSPSVIPLKRILENILKRTRTKASQRVLHKASCQHSGHKSLPSCATGHW